MVGRSPAGAAGVPGGGGDGAVWTDAVDVVVADVGSWCLRRRLAGGRARVAELVTEAVLAALGEPPDVVECDEEPHPASASAAAGTALRPAGRMRAHRLDARPCIGPP